MKKMLYISLVDWYWIKQRPQHFCEQLSNYGEVTYFSRRAWKDNPNFASKHSKEDNHLHKSYIEINNSLKVFRKKVIPKGGKYNFINALNNKLIKAYIRTINHKQNYDIIFFTHPLQYEYIDNNLLKEKVVIYDCMDNYAEFCGSDKSKILHNEKKIVDLCDYVIVSSDQLAYNLKENYPAISDKIHVINNGVDIKTFNINNIKIENEVNIFRENNRKRVGYIGTISNWVDTKLISNIAKKYNDIDFYFIGPIELGTDISQISSLENVIFTGTQPYYSVPNILKNIDVAIMPFKMSDLIKSVNPVKIYEYLALSKPVIALGYKETEKFGDLIYRYNTEQEFEKQLLIAINEDNTINTDRVSFANNNSWQKRVLELSRILQL